MGKKARYRSYRVYGRTPGDKRAKQKYLFRTAAGSKTQAIKQARHRVQGAYTITKVVAGRYL